MLLHNPQEFHNHVRARANHDLAFASLLGIVDGFERFVEDRCFDHDGGVEILKARVAAGGIYGIILLAFKSHTSMRVPFSAFRSTKGFFSSVVAGAAVSLSANAMSDWPWLPEGHL